MSSPRPQLPDRVPARHAGPDNVSGIVIVGAGPAGIAAAVTASQFERDVTLIDDNPAAGGQIWRADPSASPWLAQLSDIQFLPSTRVISADAVRQTILTDTQPAELAYSRLILATGARELFLPFPGWTLPNILGVGGLQALVKSGLPIAGKRVIVSGTGPLLLAVAAYLHKKNALVSLIAEQANLASVTQFALSLIASPSGKLRQALDLAPQRLGIRYMTSCWVEAATGTDKVERIRLRRGGARLEGILRLSRQRLRLCTEYGTRELYSAAPWKAAS